MNVALTGGGNATQPPPSTPVGVSGLFFERYLKKRMLEKEWGMFALLPPKILPSHSAFLGGDGEESGAFIFINHDEAGKPRRDLSQVRYDSDNKDERFRFPAGVGVVPYAPLPASYETFLRSSEKYLAEGVGKTLALVGLEKPVLGIAGIYNWHRKGERALMPELATRIKPSDTVTVIPDGDWRTNRNVHIAVFELFGAIRSLGATPLLLDIPDVPGLAKTGIDDLIAQWRTSGAKAKDVQKAFDALTRLKEVPSPFVVDLKRPLETARNFIAERYRHDDGHTLAHWQQDFYAWTGSRWERLSQELVRKAIYDFMQANGVNPTKPSVSLIEDALRAAAQISIKDAPDWLDGRAEQEMGPLVSLANGILNVATGELLTQTPLLFNLSASDVTFDASATCPDWEHFLSQTYPDDPSAIECLQEYMGYCLTTDTSQQKAIALIGAKRSGKGTIARVVTKLVGEAAVCNPTLQSLGENFGLQSFIGKKVAIVADARSSIRNNTQAMVERFLTITGEDGQHVDRKHKEPWEGRLPVRLWLMSNMLPATQDTGAALVSRFLILDHKVSFLGKEDTQLDTKLQDELSGILNWALRGLERLHSRGHFLQPASGAESVSAWGRLNSPLSAFLEDACEMRVGSVTEKSGLRAAFKIWCTNNDVNRHIDDSHFTLELRAASGNGVTEGQRTVDGKRVRVYVGVKLRDPTEGKKKF